MGFRSTAGTLRAFPTLGRRTFFAEQRMDAIERRVDLLGSDIGDVHRGLGDHSAVLTELLRRTTATEELLEQLHGALTAADPQTTLGIVEAVQAHVATLTIEITEQMNRTSDLLVVIAQERAATA